MAKKTELEEKAAAGTHGNSFKNRNKSTYQKRATQGPGREASGSGDAVDAHLNKLAGENRQSPDSAAAASASPNPSPQKVITKVVRSRPDPKMQEEVKKQLRDMESRHSQTIQSVMQQMQD